MPPRRNAPRRKVRRSARARSRTRSSRLLPLRRQLRSALRLTGRVIDQWIPVVYSRKVARSIFEPRRTHRQAALNTPQPYQDAKMLKQVHYPVDEVDHALAVSAGR